MLDVDRHPIIERSYWLRAQRLCDLTGLLSLYEVKHNSRRIFQHRLAQQIFVFTWESGNKQAHQTPLQGFQGFEQGVTPTEPAKA